MFVSFTLIYYNIIKQWTYNVFCVWFSRGGGGSDISLAIPSLLVISALHHVVFARPGFNYTHTDP